MTLCSHYLPKTAHVNLYETITQSQIGMCCFHSEMLQRKTFSGNVPSTSCHPHHSYNFKENSPKLQFKFYKLFNKLKQT